ncbi:MAG: hypothetical protein K8R99_05930 [Actinomycetia bacterium]|nr:hypothetical protein [Actinomycetes bacterium]
MSYRPNDEPLPTVRGLISPMPRWLYAPSDDVVRRARFDDIAAMKVRSAERLETYLELARLEHNLACDDWWMADNTFDDGPPTAPRERGLLWTTRDGYDDYDVWPSTSTPMSFDSELLE